MDYFPMFVRLRDRACLVVGGGVVAARKAEGLVRAGARVRLVAPKLGPAAQALVDAVRASARLGAFAPDDLEGATLAVAATDDALVNARVSEAARARGIPVNVVDCPELSTFIVPALIDRSPVIVAVSSAGAAPVLARTVRGQLEALLPARLGTLARVCEQLRSDVKARLPNVESRRGFWERALESHGAELALDGRADDAERELRSLLDAHAGSADHPGTLFCIGVGPGDPDLLSFRAQRAMLRAALVVHAHDVPSSIVDGCRRDAERRSWPGWQAADHGPLLSELAARAKLGQRLCVLARGDGFRGSQGRAFVAAAEALGVAVHVIPGIVEAP